MHRLALALGCFVSDIEDRMSYTEFQDWCEFYALEPFGEIRADLRAGFVASTQFNSCLGKKDRSKAMKISSAVLFDSLKKEANKEKTVDQQILAVFGGSR